jgi:hypothetical protein
MPFSFLHPPPARAENVIRHGMMICERSGRRPRTSGGMCALQDALDDRWPWEMSARHGEIAPRRSRPDLLPTGTPPRRPTAATARETSVRLCSSRRALVRLLQCFGCMMQRDPQPADTSRFPVEVRTLCTHHRTAKGQRAPRCH